MSGARRDALATFWAIVAQGGGRATDEQSPGGEIERAPLIAIIAAVVFGLLALVCVGALVYMWILPMLGSTGAQQGAGPGASPPAQAAPARADAAPSQPQAQADTAAGPGAADQPNLPKTSYDDERTAARAVLESRLPENRGLAFREVQTRLAMVNGQQVVDFCGEVNTINPTGAYVGYQRFIASRQGAEIEQDMTPGDFAEAWSQFCTGAVGPQIWR